MRILLIVNSISGNNAISNEEEAQRAKNLLEEGGELEVLLHLTTLEKPADQVAQEALEAGITTILVGGGDGTIEPVASKLVGKDATLGILPMGTFNNVARSLNIPQDLEEACRVVREGHIRKIDVGLANGEKHFFEAAGVGLDAQLFPLGEEIKSGNWLGWLEVVKRAWKFRPRPITMTFDCTVAEAVEPKQHKRYRRQTLQSRTIRRLALMAVGANGPFYGGGLAVAPDAKMTSGRINITVYRNFSKWELFRHFQSISQGRRQYSPKIESFSVGEVEFVSIPPQAVHVDGVPMGGTPLHLKALPHALRVFGPAPTSKELPPAEEQAEKAAEGVLP